MAVINGSIWGDYITPWSWFNPSTSGADIINGNDGWDFIFGGNGKDTINGGRGNDNLNGGNGNDVLTGGAGNDTFVFDTKLGASNVDHITDFSSAHDSIVINNVVMQSLWLGFLPQGQFYAHAGATGAHDSNDHIIYDTVSGKLFYDADGKGGQAAVQFAVLDNHPTLHASDFFIV